MFSTLDVDIRPGLGLGLFELGTSLWSVLDMLPRLQHIFPQVDIKYDPESSSNTPILLHLRPHLDLLFSGHHQRLHTICLRKLREPHPPVILRYQDVVLSSHEEVLRRLGVSRALGPTYPGEGLRYPGVWFSFEDDGMSDHLKGPSNATKDRMQEVKRVLVSQSALDDDDRDALDEVSECPTMYGDLARAVIKVHDGISLYFYPASSKPTRVRLGETTAQDLTLDLGPPLRIHYKEDERMKIHSTNKSQDDSAGYFYNYFQYGIDFLISGNTHIVQKIILHSNVPGTPLFQRYKRCAWEIEGKVGDDEDETPTMHFHDKFEIISHFLSPHESPSSMRLDRTDEEDDITLLSAATRLYGYDSVILEVTESSQVTSVMLF